MVLNAELAKMRENDRKCISNRALASFGPGNPKPGLRTPEGPAAAAQHLSRAQQSHGHGDIEERDGKPLPPPFPSEKRAQETVDPTMTTVLHLAIGL